MDKEFINNPVAAYEKLMDDYAELKAEIETLKSQLDFEVQKKEVLEETLQTIEQLKDEDSLRVAQLVTENARLKENDCEQCKHLDLYIKYKQTLQEIKTIAKRAFAVCDDDCGTANKFKEIIELTKAEEE